MYYVYVLKSIKNNKLYVGRTEDLKKRISKHKSGKAWTTKRMLPIKLVFYEAFLDKEDAIRRERYFKTSKGKSSLKQIIRESLRYSFYARVVEFGIHEGLKIPWEKSLAGSNPASGTIGLTLNHIGFRVLCTLRSA